MDPRSKRIAKNTLLLYGRSLIMVVVSLYTSRIMLDALGIDNYGINNVVGGIVAFSTMLTTTMVGATGRYITYSIGEGNPEKTKVVFTTAVNVHILLAIVTAIILEVGGVWFLNTEANIPPDRLYAANWVLQCSIISLMLSLIQVPYGACIVAHEHMGVYAYMGLLDIFIKLGVCYAVMYYGGDKLIFFATLSLIIGAVLKIFYALYSRFHFDEARYKLIIDKALVKEMTIYSGWNLVSYISGLLSTQGVSLLINVFFGVAYNATRAIADSVNTAISGLVGNVTSAFNPQVTKSYAAKDYDYCYKVLNRSIKFTWLLELLFLVPVCIEAKTLLSLWLVQVPPMAPLFLQFVMFQTLSLQTGSNLITLIQATGQMKYYSVWAALYAGLIFPFAWVAFYLGAPAWAAYPIFIFIYITMNIVRLWALKRVSTYNWKSYAFDVFWPCFRVTILSFILPIIIVMFWKASIVRFFVLVPICVIYTALSIYLFGINKQERMFIRGKINTFLNEKLHLKISI